MQPKWLHFVCIIKLMEIITFGYIAAGLLGLAIGSFGGAQVWRLRARQLIQDKEDGEEYDKAELKRLKPLAKAKATQDRSQCLHCHHALAWYDLIPLVSWVSSKGKCRYCKEPIGRFEPLIELGAAVLFVAFYHYWIALHPEGVWLGLALWGVILTMFVILFAYDLKWFLLPDIVMWPLIGLSAIYAGVSIVIADSSLTVLGSTIGAVVVLGGLYLALWLISKGRWVGFGDVKLGFALGLLLMDWKLALLTLLLANLIGTLIVLPGLLTGKLSRQTHVPFGPLLILGFFISLFWGNNLIAWYSDATMWLTNTLLML